MQFGNNCDLNLYVHTVHLKNNRGTPFLESLNASANTQNAL